ncbi:MAG: cytochrome c [Proteobacteria bacterium]|nr:cytochrome c [Pseudomonadota bacterium]
MMRLWGVGMRLPLAIVAVCVAILGLALGVSGCRSGNDRERSAMIASATENMKIGAWIGSEIRFQGYVEREPNPNPDVGSILYGMYCRDCHSGKTAARLEGTYETSPYVESDIHIIKYGLREMKGFNTRLTKFQILDILAYLERSWNEAHDEVHSF